MQTQTTQVNHKPGIGRAVSALAVLTLFLTTAAPVWAGGGNLMPPTARPMGYSLDDMASAVANFSASGNNLAYYPNTPFQIIYNGGSNTFTLKPGRFLYVKLFYIDDSPPVIGDWPADKAAAVNYVFGSTELGAQNLQVEVDGKVSSLQNPGYIGGPVPTPTSPDGSEHLIQIAGFLTPLTPGTHSITISGLFNGDALVALFGGPYTDTITYTVIVK